MPRLLLGFAADASPRRHQDQALPQQESPQGLDGAGAFQHPVGEPPAPRLRDGPPRSHRVHHHDLHAHSVAFLHPGHSGAPDLLLARRRLAHLPRRGAGHGGPVRQAGHHLVTLLPKVWKRRRHLPGVPRVLLRPTALGRQQAARRARVLPSPPSPLSY